MIQISIIIPVLNEAETIADHLSALKSIAPAISKEIIVVDGGSQDNTVALAKALCEKVLLSEKGRAKQMNKGAENASGKILLFLHSDTYFSDDVGSSDAFSSLSAKWGFYPVRLSGTKIIFRIVERMMNLRSRLTSVATGDQCIFVDRDLFNSVGGFCDIPLMEDVELSKRLRCYAKPYIPDVTVTTDSRRWEKNGIFKTIMLMWYLRALYCLGVSPAVLAKRYYK